MQPLKNHSGGKKVLPESTALFEQNRKVKSAYQCCQGCASRVLGEWILRVRARIWNQFCSKASKTICVWIFHFSIFCNLFILGSAAWGFNLSVWNRCRVGKYDVAKVSRVKMDIYPTLGKKFLPESLSNQSCETWDTWSPRYCPVQQIIARPPPSTRAPIKGWRCKCTDLTFKTAQINGSHRCTIKEYFWGLLIFSLFAFSCFVDLRFLHVDMLGFWHFDPFHFQHSDVLRFRSIHMLAFCQ